MLDAAMPRDSERCELQHNHLDGYIFQHEIRGRNLQKEFGCDQTTWILFMSGFGGINVAMFPNGASWYNIADDAS